MTITTAQNVGIGTTSPDTRLQVGGGIVGSNATFPGTIQVNENPSSLNQLGGIEFKTGTFGAGYGWKIASIDPGGGTPFVIGFRDNNASWTEGFRLDSGGNLRFNSGYGSVATAYGCRVWLSYNYRTQSVIASGGVSSVTYNSAGTITVNFSVTMPDTNYSVTTTSTAQNNNDINRFFMLNGSTGTPTVKTTTAIQMVSGYGNQPGNDCAFVGMAIFR
jgi:hypothetical protein